jgi:hypothetical protein
MERSEVRGRLFPDFAALHPGYRRLDKNVRSRENSYPEIRHLDHAQAIA